ncbi:hypothetical protein TGME49_297725 [Toxoplasma gondii ME49]|uniref:Uncharacterized protein n=10 Tax=Toxoplasma gondii TaxID=5811 RepID=A0A125YUJ2_TOXGV|nr:hypothetical protein TGME49_297725 [Toxoplasma gondii ME49]EPR58369.1 hypothetical protein TGGT1_297725 [Toxoplasma gondii GT1]ESS29910.1 hypothetical protein TGVEG_297725 [Toxoplasma gondii VEG]KFG30052.1 hypothetical protein TGP89_297725 [Toxoplasma gondii p89]KFG39980.1 hypothetical protein TGFOU_297725 [Toxoplasma gondii FOU]KFG41981.1 hypothetical protein TGDOM2_297725 [Toxoplasma gondii GAB2-2007-GAL-DOM2]KFG61323.1 hypothetical protein TGRUB_297725 [Toxoplasma gondii RUB]KFH01004.1|eukprot:XP_018638374.1 hypothetical protein TGME49_297725 [Toxoplasma gondii ME49]
MRKNRRTLNGDERDDTVTLERVEAFPVFSCGSPKNAWIRVTSLPHELSFVAVTPSKRNKTLTILSEHSEL